MESHFIKGTNKQYSIREDGKLIRHYSLSRDGKKNKVYKDVLVKPRLGKHNSVYYSVCGKQGTLHNLVSEYYSIKNDYTHIGSNHLKIVHLDGDPFNCSVSNLEFVPRKSVVITCKNLSYKEKEHIYYKRSYSKNRDKIIQYIKKYADNNKSLISQRNKAYRCLNKEYLLLKSKKERERIDKAYAASKLGLSVKELTEELYNLYKTNLKIKRKLSNLTGKPTCSI